MDKENKEIRKAHALAAAELIKTTVVMLHEQNMEVNRVTVVGLASLVLRDVLEQVVE